MDRRAGPPAGEAWASFLRIRGAGRGDAGDAPQCATRIVTPLRFTPGNDAWLFGLCRSRVGAFMVYISYAAALPVLQREWQMSGTGMGASLVAGVIADRVGRTQVIVAMASLSTLCSRTH